MLYDDFIKVFFKVNKFVDSEFILAIFLFESKIKGKLELLVPGIAILKILDDDVVVQDKAFIPDKF